ncbi:MAG: cytochrome P450 [Chloroflexi bacterium]|nr:cytochrome P450 [Chloroflexota bacterium]
MNVSHEIPGPPPIKGILNTLRFFSGFSRDFLGTVDRQFDTYGDLVKLQFGKEAMVLVSRPEHLHEILVTRADDFHKDRLYKDTQRGLAAFLGNGLLTSDGEFWKRQRRLVAPALHTRRIASYAQIMVDTTQEQSKAWRHGERRDIDHDMMRTTMLIVAQSLFRADVAGQTERVGEVMTILQNMFAPSNLMPAWVPTPKRLRERRAIRDLDAIVYGLIVQWRARGEDRGDLLSMLMLARDDDGNPMSDKQVRDEVVTLFLAGHETTANAMNFTWVLLAQNPAVEARLHEELDRVLAGRTPTLDDLPQLPYVEMVIKESMRLYPPAFSFGRQAIRDTSIGEYPIAAATQVTVLSSRTHRDPRYWDSPEQFMPERFSPEREGQIEKYAYLPFGGGPRICVGNSFAMMEARLMLATIAQRYRLRLPPGHQVEVDPLITLRPKGGLPMIVERREPLAARDRVNGMANAVPVA